MEEIFKKSIQINNKEIYDWVHMEIRWRGSIWTPMVGTPALIHIDYHLDQYAPQKLSQ